LFKIVHRRAGDGAGLVNPETMIDTQGPHDLGRFRINDFPLTGPNSRHGRDREVSNIGTAQSPDDRPERSSEFLEPRAPGAHRP
jgi:cell division protein FtsI (penicillin-binding protein 3)